MLKFHTLFNPTLSRRNILAYQNSIFQAARIKVIYHSMIHQHNNLYQLQHDLYCHIYLWIDDNLGHICYKQSCRHDLQYRLKGTTFEFGRVQDPLQVFSILTNQMIRVHFISLNDLKLYCFQTLPFAFSSFGKVSQLCH